MVDYTYTTSNRLKEFFEKLPKWGVPDKVSASYLPRMGFKGSNDRSILRVLKSLKMIDKGGVPTQRYKDYRKKANERTALMALWTKETYNDLFRDHPDAHKLDRKELEIYFSGATEKGEQVVMAFTRTFETLRDLSDFKATPAAKMLLSNGKTVPVHKESTSQKAVKSIPTININIQLVLPEAKDPATYDRIFQSLKKHLIE